MSDFSEFRSLGFTPSWQALFAPHASQDSAPARVIRADRGSALVAAPRGVIRAAPSTTLLKASSGPADLPVAGDWVVLYAPPELDVPLIESLLQRSSAITRGDPGEPSHVQVLAANIDVVFIVHPIDGTPNLRRIERELALVWDSGAIPVIVLTKADVSARPDAAREAVEAVAFGADVLLTSALAGLGIQALLPYIADHRTAVLIGPSGAGKSTLINALLGEDRQATREVRMSDRRGRHATVARELIQMPGGGLLIDTPGLRALALTGSEVGISATFADIEQVAQSCRFRDCTHNGEPGCAVQAAVESGALPAARLDNYHKLLREAEVAAMKTDVRLRTEERRKWKVIRKAAREYYKRTGGG